MKCRILGWVMLAASLVGCAMDAVALEPTPLEELGSMGEELSRNALSPRQQAMALEVIDDICGDTWCEGDHNFR